MRPSAPCFLHNLSPLWLSNFYMAPTELCYQELHSTSFQPQLPWAYILGMQWKEVDQKRSEVNRTSISFPAKSDGWMLQWKTDICHHLLHCSSISQGHLQGQGKVSTIPQNHHSHTQLVFTGFSFLLAWVEQIADLLPRRFFLWMVCLLFSLTLIYPFFCSISLPCLLPCLFPLPTFL